LRFGTTRVLGCCNGLVLNTPREPTEAEWEAFALDWLHGQGWEHLPGAAVAPRTRSDRLERPGWDELVLVDRLRAAIERINPGLPPPAVDDAVAQVRRRESQDPLAENFRVHQLLIHGVRVSYDDHGVERNPTVWLLDFGMPYANEFLAVNQVLFRFGQHERKFDIVCYVNGLPLAVFELKKAGDEDVDSLTAHRQLRTYLHELGAAAFAIPAIAVASDGVTARVGTVFTPWEHFAPWDVDEWGSPIDLADGTALEVLIAGVFEPHRLLDLLANFVSFSAEGGGAIDTKKVAKAHQYFAVNKAIDATVRAVASDGRAGVVWHTQGAGKSKEMEFYTAKVLRDRRLGNPTIVVLTDRLDLDDQLFQTFSASRLLPERPVQVGGRDELRDELLSRATGGIVFTTLQKFGRTEEERKAGREHPTLSTRKNVIVIADEAHRSHYDFLDGFARNLRDALPNATFIAFTGTPISQAERNTRAVFGDYIDIYDLSRAVADGATVRVFYENRHVPVRLPEDIDPDDLDERAAEAIAQLPAEQQRTVERAFRMIEQVVGAPERLEQVAADIVGHWEHRREQMAKHTGVPGKGLIVCLSRRVCALLYDELVALRPEWAREADDKGTLKVVYDARPSDPEPISHHARNESRNKAIQQRMREPDDELELVIVTSMWLTGFDCPPLHTLYLDKPMRGAALMQAITRVNRPFRDKPAGLIVDYIGITEKLTEALAEYTRSDQQERPIGADVSEAVGVVREQHGVICQILRGYDWRAVLLSGRKTARLDATLGVVNYLRDPVRAENLRGRGEPDLAERFAKAVRVLLRAFALCPAHPDVQEYRDDIEFFDSVRIWMAKFDAEERTARGLPNPPDVELALRQLAAGAVAAGEVMDIFAAAGIDRPDLTHLDEAFIERMLRSTRPNLAIEALRRMLERQIRATHPHNLVAQRRFSDWLLEAMRRYTNNALTTAEIITELVALANEIHADRDRARALGLDEDELAFYDAVATNESAVRELGTNRLAMIARDLVSSIRRDVTVDWAVREQARARLRSNVKRLLARYGYPPDAEQQAIVLLLEQTETFAEKWAA
jgi:type I restriction enzyme R subunit